MEVYIRDFALFSSYRTLLILARRTPARASPRRILLRLAGGRERPFLAAQKAAKNREMRHRFRLRVLLIFAYFVNGNADYAARR